MNLAGEYVCTYKCDVRAHLSSSSFIYQSKNEKRPQLKFKRCDLKIKVGWLSCLPAACPIFYDLSSACNI